MEKELIVISGPTACGKTKAAINLAKAINGEIISADSMQVYKYMDIGTAKPSVEEMDGVPHYLIDVYYPDFEYSAFVFQKEAKVLIEHIVAKGKTPIIAGGTGFYINTLLFDNNFTETTSEEIRKGLYDQALSYGNEYLHKQLQEVDPESAIAIHQNNLKRVVRALEYNIISGEKFSEHNKKERANTIKYNAKIFILNFDRQELYHRINFRVDIMVEQGLFNEVSSLLNMGYGEGLVSMQGLGYKEVVKFFKGEYSKEEAIEQIKQGTRRFAKRQITWFKHQLSGNWLRGDEVDELIKLAKE